MGHIGELNKIFKLQKSSGFPSNATDYDIRMDRLSRLENLCKNHITEISSALQEDFGSRHSDWTFTADLYSPLSHLKHIKRHLKKWMKKERTTSGIFSLTGQQTYIIHEPLGVVGIMSPFNAPVSLGFDPAIEAIAAGNNVMIKMPENTPETSEMIKTLVSKYFDESELAVITGGLKISKKFASMPWDLLFFTGGSEVGKHILGAAANNLTPVILELGGKSPCVILEDADISEAAEKIGKVRQLNAGQVCISGDYVLLPKNRLDEFVDVVINISKETYPSIIKNENFTSIINQTEYDRIVGYIDEAKESGCRVMVCNPNHENVPDPISRKIPLTLIVNPTDDLMVSQNEVFGPILSVYTYQKLEGAIDYINNKPKPLALYIFGNNRPEIEQILDNTSSGGVTINDMLLHANAHDMGFGGVGNSGMGRYKGGFIGYKSFSNPKSVLESGMMRKFTSRFFPPYKGDRIRRMLRSQVGVK